MCSYFAFLFYVCACHACEPVIYAVTLIKRLQHETSEVSHKHQARSKASSQLTTRLGHSLSPRKAD